MGLWLLIDGDDGAGPVDVCGSVTVDVMRWLWLAAYEPRSLFQHRSRVAFDGGKEAMKMLLCLDALAVSMSAPSKRTEGSAETGRVFC